MLTWLLVNVLLSALALVFITLNGSAPHRLRFFAGFAALAAWLVPWPLLPDLLPANMFSFELWRMERAVEATSTRITGVIPVIIGTGSPEAAPRFIVLSVIELGFVALNAIGCALFAWKVAAHQLLLRRLERTGGDGNWLWARAGLEPVCAVGVQREIAGAFSSGLLRPRIWVHGDLVQSPQLSTLLQHEVTHIRQHDNWYLLAITFVERLFWWNPLVWYLGRRTRELQELSCDERCQRTNSAYPAELAQLMLDSARGGMQPRMLALGANIFDQPNPNVKRIQLLLSHRTYTMTKKHVLGAAITSASAFLAVGFVTAQPDEVVQAVPGQRLDVFRVERAPGSADDQYVRIEAVGGEELISFAFDDAPLPAVLMPLVGFVVHEVPVPGSMNVAMVRALGEDADAIYGMSPDEVMAKVKDLGGTASWVEAGHVVTFSATRVAPGIPAGAGAGGFRASFAVNGLNDKLVLEYPQAADQLVSVTVADVTLDEAIAAVAEASGCNIFQDGDTIVVDYCDE